MYGELGGAGFGMDLSTAQDINMSRVVLPPRTEMLDHLGAKAFYENLRDVLLNEGLAIAVITGRHGVGKTTTASQLIRTAEKDRAIRKWTNHNNFHDLEIAYLPFASSANSAKELHLIDPSKKHGEYSEEDYAKASALQLRWVSREARRRDAPKIIVVEASGPSAWQDPESGIKTGMDRGYSSLVYLAQEHPQVTKVGVVMRTEDWVSKVVNARRDIAEKGPEELAEILKRDKRRIVVNGITVDLENLLPEDQRKYQKGFIEGAAGAEGVIRGNRETDELKERMGIKDETTFWIAYLNVIGFRADQYDLLPNPRTTKVLSYHADANRYNPIEREIELLHVVSSQRDKKR